MCEPLDCTEKRGANGYRHLRARHQEMLFTSLCENLQHFLQYQSKQVQICSKPSFDRCFARWSRMIALWTSSLRLCQYEVIEQLPQSPASHTKHAQRPLPDTPFASTKERAAGALSFRQFASCFKISSGEDDMQALPLSEISVRAAAPSWDPTAKS